jgi:hypothetical protein
LKNSKATASGVDFVKAENERKSLFAQIGEDLRNLDSEKRDGYINEKASGIGLSVGAVRDFLTKQTIHTENTIGKKARELALIEGIKRADAALIMESFNNGLDHAEKSETYKKGLTGKFSDLVGSATKNKVLGHGKYGFGGHSNIYLKRKGSGETEVFANLTTLLGDSNDVWDKIVNSLYPKTSSLFMEIMKNE